MSWPIWMLGHWPDFRLRPWGRKRSRIWRDDFDQQVDFGRRVVEIEAGPRAGGDAEAVVERPGAVVAGADGDALLVEQLGDVVGVRLGRA